MAKIVSIQGSNGSGKSTIVYNILSAYPHRPIYGISGPRYPEAYEINIVQEEPLYVLGPYHTPTGGADWIGDFEKLLSLINKYRVKGHVLFEGLITSGVRGRVGEVLELYGKDSAVFFVDTPLETCIERVKARRTKKGNQKEFNPRNLIKKYQAVQRTKKRYTNDDIITVMGGSSEDGADIIIKFCQDGFECPICHAPGATADGCSICGTGPAG